jgi:patatin-like phospholipase/acyl hydrolase
MTKTFTENDLIKYCYQEVNDQEKIEIEQAIKNSISLQQEWESLSETIDLLDHFMLKAPENVVDRVMYASRNSLTA